MASALGQTQDVATYTALQQALIAQFNQAFFNTGSLVYDTGTRHWYYCIVFTILFPGLQAAQVLPLWLDIVPPAGRLAAE